MGISQRNHSEILDKMTRMRRAHEDHADAVATVPIATANADIGEREINSAQRKQKDRLAAVSPKFEQQF